MNTTLLASILAGVMIAGGLGLALLGLQPRPAPQPRPNRHPIAPAWIVRMPRWQRIATLAAVAAGILIATLTGWVVLIILLPLAVAGLPVLLATSDAAPRIARMEAIAEWTRNLSGVLTAGQGMEQALTASLRSTPDAIRPQVSQLVGRLRARWSTEAALRAFADDLGDATGDLVVAALILGSRKRGEGIARVLNGLAESVADDVRVRRQLEADRAKPRSSARTTTLISLGALAVFAVSGQFLAPYSSPLGQALLTLYLAAYVGCAIWLRRLAAEPAAVRFVTRRKEPTR